MGIFFTITIVVVLLVAVPIVAGHVAFSVTPQPSKRTPESLGLAFQDIYFRNANNEVLHGWWIPHSEASKEEPCPTLVFVHGWGRNCERMLPYMDACRDLPVNLLAIDVRGHGENAKNNFITEVGIADDINAAIDWLVLQPGVDIQRIGLMGHSFGAAATIMESSRDKRIAAFVADGSFANPMDILKEMMESKKVPYIPLGWLIRQYIQMRLNATFDQIAPENRITSTQSPGLLIHGDKDPVIPVEDSHRILGNAGENVQLWIANGCDHSNTPEHPDFQNVLRNFLRQSLIDLPPAPGDSPAEEHFSPIVN
ncbi:MAG: alpha/beta fold hydrolase [Candidatus Marinimicrobia bacterium]|nr:alpha/beta fold hydrolase [Candidatus Neomarinimicrobiota bacterium]MCF7827805.1 alpha/beta fold hydrolase [Candidatus Neomarinimicrobiota bacterium]MCF7879440.1 alpha/beta fold hydrolase [Candidatus Neomarinimicrobiota bacterium]